MRTSVLLLALLILPAVAADSFAADEVHGQGPLAIHADQALVGIRPSSSAPTLRLAGTVSIEVTDDQVDQARLEVPGQPRRDLLQLRNTTSSSHGPFQDPRVQVLALDMDAVLVLVAEDLTVDAQLTGWRAGAIDYALVEESHANTRGSGHPDYYAYEARDAVNITSESGTLRAAGRFTLYAWGLTLQVGDEVLQLGSWDATPGPVVYHAHNAYALLHVDGVLELEADGFQILAPMAVATPSDFALEAAEGELQGAVHDHELRGDGSGRGGQYQLASQGGRLEILALRAPDAVAGAGVTTTWAPLREAWFVPAVTGAAAAVVLPVLVVLFRSGLLGSAEDWLARSNRRQLAGQRRLSLALVAAAARLGAPAGDVAMLRAQARADHDVFAAILHYEAAFRSLADVRDRAEAAYGAATCQARIGNAGSAARWLETALRYDGSHLERAAGDPAFHAVSEDPQFRAAVQRLLGDVERP